MLKDSSSLSCITRVLDFPAYKRVRAVQASWDVLWAAMRGVMVVEVEARMAWRISLSLRIHWEFIALEAEELSSSMVGHFLSPVTKSMISYPISNTSN